MSGILTFTCLFIFCHVLLVSPFFLQVCCASCCSSSPSFSLSVGCSFSWSEVARRWEPSAPTSGATSALRWSLQYHTCHPSFDKTLPTFTLTSILSLHLVYFPLHLQCSLSFPLPTCPCRSIKPPPSPSSSPCSDKCVTNLSSLLSCTQSFSRSLPLSALPWKVTLLPVLFAAFHQPSLLVVHQLRSSCCHLS